MGRIEHFRNNNMDCARYELDGHPIREETRMRSCTYYGKEYPMQVRIWYGLHMLRRGDREILVEQTTIHDGGEKLGVAITATIPPEVPPTEEEREANRRQVIAVATQILRDKGIW